MPDYKGLGYLKRKLEAKTVRIITRYEFYEMKNQTFDFGISTPPDLRRWNSVVGWCAKAVDTLADRLIFHSFRKDNFDMEGVFNMNNPDILFDSAILSALISSCCFIYISEDATGFPRLQVIDGANATGIMDPITGLLNEGYAVLTRDEYGNPDMEAHFKYNATEFYKKGKRVLVRKNKAPFPLLVPVIFRPDARRPFGHSRISRACMSLTGSALRTIKRSEISAEFYSFPQKYAVGVSEDLELEPWKASMSALLKITKDEDDDKPTVGQFAQQSMEPHIAQLRMFASLFAGETGLTLDDLGFATENPTSAEAIKAAHENLRLTAKKAQRTFGSGFLNAGYLAACIRDNYKYQRQQVYQTQVAWEPVFASDAAMIGAIGDGLGKIGTAFPGYVTKEKLYDITGI